MSKITDLLKQRRKERWNSIVVFLGVMFAGLVVLELIALIDTFLGLMIGLFFCMFALACREEKWRSLKESSIFEMDPIAEAYHYYMIEINRPIFTRVEGQRNQAQDYDTMLAEQADDKERIGKGAYLERR